MPIKFEDIIENNNTAFTVVSAINNSVNGIYWAGSTSVRDGIGSSNINSDDRRAQYCVVFVADTPYIYTSSSIADVDWENTANWTEIGTGGGGGGGTATDVDSLTDVTIGTQAAGDILVASGTTDWENVTPATWATANLNIEDLKNVDDTNLATDDFLTWDGTDWVRSTKPADNAANIATNASDISTNAADISTNASDITGFNTSLGITNGNVTTAQSTANTAASDASLAATQAANALTASATNTAGLTGTNVAVSNINTALGKAAADTDLGTYTGDNLTDNTTVKANLQELSDGLDDKTPEITGLTETTSWGTDDDDITDNLGDAMIVYHDGTGYKKASLFSLFEGLALSVALENPDLFGTQLGSAVNPLDFNGDGVVGASDLTMFLTAFGALGNEFNDSAWQVGMQPVNSSVDTYNDLTCQNPSMHLNMNNAYTADTWKTFDIDMQDSDVTDGGTTATLKRTTGSASTIYDTSSNEWVGFQSNNALESFHTFPDNPNLRVIISQAKTKLNWESNGFDFLHFRITVRGYDSNGTQLTFADGSSYEYQSNEYTTVTQTGNYTINPFTTNVVFDLQANSDLDSVRITAEAMAEYGKIANMTLGTEYTMNG